jgi:ureidoacrylate peracid hydrolase
VHKSEIPEEVRRQVSQQRGRLNRRDRLTPARTALLVIDMQNGFLLPGMPLETPAARDIIPNINRLAAALRAGGGRVVWIQMKLQGQEHDWSVFFAGGSETAALTDVVRLLSPGEPGFALHAALDVAPQDATVEKTRFSAFFPGSSNLEQVLRAAAIDTVIVTGTLTNVCCESTARDAMMHNYKVIVVSDGNATVSDTEHNAALTNIVRAFGDVLSTEEVIEHLRIPAAAVKQVTSGGMQDE